VVPANPFENTEKSAPRKVVSLVRKWDNGGGNDTGGQLSPGEAAQRYDTRAKLNENSDFADFRWCGRALRHNLKSSRKRSI
jgi:hypothetical protein